MPDPDTRSNRAPGILDQRPWEPDAARRIILAMSTTPATASRYLLLAQSPRLARGAQGPKVRRYRLAKLQVNERRDGFSHLKRSYD